jgi:hypothetical protein
MELTASCGCQLAGTLIFSKVYTYNDVIYIYSKLDSKINKYNSKNNIALSVANFVARRNDFNHYVLVKWFDRPQLLKLLTQAFTQVLRINGDRFYPTLFLSSSSLILISWFSTCYSVNN